MLLPRLMFMMILIGKAIQTPSFRLSRWQEKTRVLTVRSENGPRPSDDSSPDNEYPRGEEVPYKPSPGVNRPVPDFGNSFSVPDRTIPEHLRPIHPNDMEIEAGHFQRMMRQACRDCLLECVSKNVRIENGPRGRREIDGSGSQGLRDE